MGIEPWLGYGPWRIAEQNKLFAKQGVSVKITNFETDDQINAALAAKKLDGANIATHTALRLAAAGLPITIVLLLDESDDGRRDPRRARRRRRSSRSRARPSPTRPARRATSCCATPSVRTA